MKKTKISKYIKNIKIDKIVAFLYNRQYMRCIFMTGWVLADSEVNNEMAAQRLGVVLPKSKRK